MVYAEEAIITGCVFMNMLSFHYKSRDLDWSYEAVIVIIPFHRIDIYNACHAYRSKMCRGEDFGDNRPSAKESQKKLQYISHFISSN